MYFNPRKRKYLFLLNWHQALLRGSYIHHNATQLNNVQHNNNLNATLSLMPITIMAECCYAECHFCSVSFMPSVTNKPFILSVIMLSVVMLSVSYDECLK